VHKPGSREVVKHILADLDQGKLSTSKRNPRSIVDLLTRRAIPFVTFDQFKALDELEIARGQHRGAPREKFWAVDHMLEALRQQA
jgi:ferredoxin--NADP+ reductase